MEFLRIFFRYIRLSIKSKIEATGISGWDVFLRIFFL